jgi:hypothetical protein
MRFRRHDTTVAPFHHRSAPTTAVCVASMHLCSAPISPSPIHSDTPHCCWLPRGKTWRDSGAGEGKPPVPTLDSFRCGQEALCCVVGRPTAASSTRDRAKQASINIRASVYLAVGELSAYVGARYKAVPSHSQPETQVPQCHTRFQILAHRVDTRGTPLLLKTPWLQPLPSPLDKATVPTTAHIPPTPRNPQFLHERTEPSPNARVCF